MPISFDMNLLLILFTFIVSFLLCFLTVPGVMVLAKRVGAMDIPKDKRRMHTEPIPRLGGLAIYIGFLAAVLLFCPTITPALRGILIGSVMMIVIGVMDDINALPALPKLLVQIVAAVVVVLHGVVITYFENPFPFGPENFQLGWFAYPVTVLWIVGVTNAINLIDGLDGLAAGISSIASVSIFIIAWLTSAPEIALIMAALCGACFGFLPYNYNPAKIFMGDTGALFLGFILASVSISGLFKSSALVSVAVPFLVLGLPIYDVLFAIGRRVLKHQPIMQPDRGHLHHRLIDMGLSQRQVVTILYSVSGTLGLSAIILATGLSGRAFALMLLLLALTVLEFYLLRWDAKKQKEEVLEDEES